MCVYVCVGHRILIYLEAIPFEKTPFGLLFYAAAAAATERDDSCFTQSGPLLRALVTG